MNSQVPIHPFQRNRDVKAERKYEDKSKAILSDQSQSQQSDDQSCHSLKHEGESKGPKVKGRPGLRKKEPSQDQVMSDELPPMIFPQNSRHASKDSGISPFQASSAFRTHEKTPQILNQPASEQNNGRANNTTNRKNKRSFYEAGLEEITTQPSIHSGVSQQLSYQSPSAFSQVELEGRLQPYKRPETDQELQHMDEQMLNESSIMVAFGGLGMEEELHRKVDLEDDKSLSMGTESEKENDFQRHINDQTTSMGGQQMRGPLQIILEESDQQMTGAGEGRLEAEEKLDAALVEWDVEEMEGGIVSAVINRERVYQIDPDYLSKQKDIQFHMRLMLLDWMMEVCEEFGLKRETFHLAAYFSDLYLTNKVCPMDKLQNLGASSLLLASKQEEVMCPRAKDFSFATDNGFNSQDIITMEEQICKVLGFKLNPVTLNYWTNFMMSKWDLYCQANPRKSELLVVDEISRPPLFKSDNMEDYKRFRSVFQVIDLLVLDINTFKLEKRKLVAATIYIQLGFHFNMFTRQEIAFVEDTQMFLGSLEEDNPAFNEVMEHFLEWQFGITILELLEQIQYVSRFFQLEPNYTLPLHLKNQKDASSVLSLLMFLQSSQEEFYSFQCHVKSGQKLVKYLQSKNIQKNLPLSQ